LIAIVDALMALPVFQDDNQRRLLLSLLPQRIAAQVPTHQVPRLQVIALVQTCERYPDGSQALISGLETILGPDDPGLARARDVLGRFWRPAN
jgi:hypothetical protein